MHNLTGHSNESVLLFNILLVLLCEDLISIILYLMIQVMCNKIIFPVFDWMEQRQKNPKETKIYGTYYML